MFSRQIVRSCLFTGNFPPPRQAKEGERGVNVKQTLSRVLSPSPLISFSLPREEKQASRRIMWGKSRVV